MNAKPQHIPALDGVRGIAALMVMVFHWFQGFEGNLGQFEPFRRVTVFGQTGVDLFFVLSGFLITRILLSSTSEHHYFRNFYVRRSLRIFPLYYGFLLFFYLGWSRVVPPDKESGALWYLSYLQNVQSTFGSQELHGPGHFWSLAVEEHFYLLWPLAVWLLPTKRLPWAIFGMLAVSIAGRMLLQSLNLGIFYFTLTRLDGLAVGAFIAWLEHRNSGLDAFKTAARWSVGLLLPSLVVIWSFATGRGLEWIQTFKFTVIALFFGAFICAIPTLGWGTKLNAILCSRPLGWIGLVSYGAYVFHPICFESVHLMKISNPVMNFTAGFLLTFGVAGMSYYGFERLFLRLKNNFAPRGQVSPSPCPVPLER